MLETDPAPRRMMPSIIAFGIAQIIGWGVTFNLPGVIGTSIAESFESSLDVVLLGPTIMLTIVAVVSWFIAPLFERFGARLLMVAGALVMATGLTVALIAPNVQTFLAAWIFFGIGGAASLSTAAQIALAEVFGDRARQAISAMSLVSGLSNTILWPIISRIDDNFGWRWVIGFAIAAVLLVYVPIVSVFGARRAIERDSEPSNSEPSETHRLDPLRFILVAAVTALNGFITWGFSLTLIPLLTHKGLETGQAVTLASSLGLISIAARSFDVLGNWSPLRSAFASTGGMFAAFVLLYFGSSVWVAGTFILVYGMASGLMAVVRATLPLTMFPARAYARAAAKLALPLNLSFAAAPPIFAWILENHGANSALMLSVGLGGVAMICLITLALLVRRQDANLGADSAIPA